MKQSSNSIRNKEQRANHNRQNLTVQSRKVFPQSSADNDDTQASENTIDQMEAPYSFCNSVRVINDVDSSSQQNSNQSHFYQNQSNSKAHLESKIFKRWLDQSQLKEDIETYLSRKYMQFRKYKFNIYILQRSALKIQHWFFKIKYNLLQKQIQLQMQQEILERERLSFLKAEQLVNDLLDIKNTHSIQNNSPEEEMRSKNKQQAKSIDSKPSRSSKSKQQFITNLNRNIFTQDKSKGIKQHSVQGQELKIAYSKIQQSKTPIKQRQNQLRHTGSKETFVFGYNQQPNKTLYSNDFLMSVRTNQNMLQKSLEKLYERKQSPRQKLDGSRQEKSMDQSPCNFPLRNKNKQSQVVQIDLNQQLSESGIAFIVSRRNNTFLTKQPSSQVLQQQKKENDKNLVEYLDLSSPSPIKFEQQPYQKEVSPLIKLQNCAEHTSMNDSLVHIKDSNFNSEEEKLEDLSPQINLANRKQIIDKVQICSPEQQVNIRSYELIKSHASLSKKLVQHKRLHDESFKHRSVSNPRDIFMRQSTINATSIKNPPQFKILKINLPQKHNFQNTSNRQTQSNLRGSITSLNDFSQTLNPRNRNSASKSSLSSSFILPQSSFVLKHNESEIIDQNNSNINNSNISILDSASRKNNYLKSIQQKYLSKSKKKQQILNRSLDFSFTSLSQTLVNKNVDDSRSQRDEDDTTSPFGKIQKHRKSQERLESSVSMLNQRFEEQYIERLGNMKIINERFLLDQTQ